jgi:hypothetical protein
LQIREEKKRLSERIKLLTSSEYALNLSKELSKLNEKIAGLNAENHQLKVQEKKVGKLLEDVLETGEMTEHSKELQHLLSIKLHMLTLIETKEIKISDMQNRITGLVKKLESSDQEIFHNQIEDKNEKEKIALEKKYEAVKADGKRKERMIDQTIRSLKIKVVNLTLQYRSLEEAESKLQEDYESRNSELDKHRSRLQMIKSVDTLRELPKSKSFITSLFNSPRQALKNLLDSPSP